MTNNNNTKATNCACARLTCASFVAGNQCFGCEQVDNREAGITFEHEMLEWGVWFRQNEARIVEHEAGPNYIDPKRYAGSEGEWDGVSRAGVYNQWHDGGTIGRYRHET